MNILIENSDTMQFLANSGQWTKNPRSGHAFPTREAALQAAKLEAIGAFTIVGHFSETNQFINLDHGHGKGLPKLDSDSPQAILGVD